MEADNGNDAGDTTERQQFQAQSSQVGTEPPILLTSQVKLIQL
jgi:hypothetical protein